MLRRSRHRGRSPRCQVRWYLYRRRWRRLFRDVRHLARFSVDPCGMRTPPVRGPAPKLTRPEQVTRMAVRPHLDGACRRRYRHPRSQGVSLEAGPLERHTRPVQRYMHPLPFY